MPLHTAAAHCCLCTPHMCFLRSGMWTLSPDFSPTLSPGVPTESWPNGALAAGWHHDSPGNTQPSAPSKPSFVWLLPESPGCPGREGQLWVQRRLCTNPSFHPLALSLAGTALQQSRRAPAGVAARPAEATHEAVLGLLGMSQRRGSLPACRSAPARQGICPVAVEPLTICWLGQPRGSFRPLPPLGLG